MDGMPYRTHIPITGKYKKAKEDEPILRAGYAFGAPLCMKEVGSPVFREDVHQDYGSKLPTGIAIMGGSESGI